MGLDEILKKHIPGAELNPEDRKRLETSIDKSISYVRSLGLDHQIGQHLYIAQTPEEFIEGFHLRTKMYKQEGFDAEFKEVVPGLEFDQYDARSIHLVYKNDEGRVIGYMRLIKDEEKDEVGLNKLPTMGEVRNEDKPFFKKYLHLGEASRLAIHNDYRSHNDREVFRTLWAGVYHAASRTNIDRFLMVMREGQSKWYQRLGGTKLLNTLDGYGELKERFSVLLWNHRDHSQYARQQILPMLN